MTADELVLHVEGALALASEYAGQGGSKIQASFTALKNVGDAKNKAASGDALRVFKEQLVLVESGVTAIVGDLNALLKKVQSAEFKAAAGADAMEIEIAAREATDLAARPQGLLDEAIARAEREFAQLSHDLILFVAFDIKDYKLAQFRRKAEVNRKVRSGKALSSGVVREYEMSGSRTLRYLEVRLSPAEFDGPTPPELLDAFSRLTQRSKVVLLGHGAPESDAIGTEGTDGTGKRLITFESVFKRFASEIHERTKGTFGSPTGPLLDVTLFSCEGAATRSYETDASDKIVVKNGVLVRGNGQVVDARATMAGKLIAALREGGVYARVKARMTVVYPPSSEKVNVGSDDEQRIVQGLFAMQSRRGAELVTLGRELDRSRENYVPADLAVRAAWRTKSGQGRDVSTFTTSNPNPKKYASTPTLYEHGYVKETVFQGKARRRHGYKRVFTWREDGTLRCIDIADGLEVDFVFETNKDRALWFLMGTARHLAQDAIHKYDAMMALCDKIESATNGAELARRMREIAESPAVTTNTSKLSRLLGTATRSSKVLGEVAKMLEKNPPELLPMPQWEDRKLGL